MKKGDTVTLRCGDSSLRRKGSFSGLPMVKLPPGMATILSDADVPGIVSVLLIAGLCFALPSYSFAFWQSDITLEDESIYNYLQVQDDAKRTTLSTNVLFGVQSVQVKGDALTVL